eukprot:2507846-Rhodomonas_salina.1
MVMGGGLTEVMGAGQDADTVASSAGVGGEPRLRGKEIGLAQVGCKSQGAAGSKSDAAHRTYEVFLCYERDTRKLTLSLLLGWRAPLVGEFCLQSRAPSYALWNFT